MIEKVWFDDGTDWDTPQPLALDVQWTEGRNVIGTILDPSGQPLSVVREPHRPIGYVWR